MKLLDRREIDVAKAAEKRVEIEEGRKLAVRVDSLRELFSKEQGSLAKYRDETIKEALAQCQEAIDKRDRARGEQKEAEEARLSAMRPVTEELETAKAVRKEADGLLVEANRILDEANAKMQEANAAAEVIPGQRAQAEREVMAAKELGEETIRLNKAANQKLRDAEKFLKDSTAQAIATATAADVRDKESKAREDAVILAERAVAHDREGLSAYERAIIDREETFKREQKRTNK